MSIITGESQQTLAGPVTLEGLGLFMGQAVTVRIKPAPENHGLVFVRTDLSEGSSRSYVPAQVRHVTKRARRSALRCGSGAIETCEHCLSALFGMGIDNALIEVHGPELPGFDGSSEPYVKAISQVGLKVQNQPRRVYAIDQPMTVEEGDSMIAALPSDSPGFQIIYNLDYGQDAPFPRQVFAFNSVNNDYAQDVAPARTYTLEEEARALHAKGIGTHLSPDDVLVVGPDGPLGNNAFRFDDELVRHKVLDVIGDLALLGIRIQGQIIASRSGHSTNHRLVRELHKQMTASRRQQLVSGEGEINIRQLQRLLPHRYPMLMIDRVLEVDDSKRAVGIKNVTVNEPFFTGHYPGTPIMPGVLIVEAMAQLSGVLLSQKLEHTGKLAVLLAMDKVKLRKPVTPGDQLVIEAETIRVRARTGHTRCRAYIGPHLAAEAQIKFMLVDAEQD